jgi:hypothetical protein
MSETVIHISGLSSERKTLKDFSCPAYAHAPPYFCHHVRNHLDRDGWEMDRQGPVPWPPTSPYLTPLDFFLWGYVINDLQHL